MGKNSYIQWTDHTFNPWEGCTKVSPGCAHCYAEARNARFGGGTAPNWGKGAPRRRTSVSNWNQPRKWDRDVAEALNEYEGHKMLHSGFAHYDQPRRPRVFCASLADWLDDEVPIAWLADLLELIRSTPALDWQLLTKRPQNWAARLEEIAHSVAGFNSLLYSWVIEWLDRAAPRNVWIGTTVEDQVRADERIPALLKIPARVRFLSCEPLLGPVNLHAGVKRPEGYRGYFDWVICGGESGPGARPMHPEWARNLRDQCAAAGVPFFFKQWGEWVPWSRDLGDITGMESDHVMLNGSKYFPCNFGSSLKRWSVSASTPPAAS